MLPAHDAWKVAPPLDAGAWLARAPCPWWIAGGQGLDVFLGESTRPHHDLDAGCFRADWPALRGACLGDWTVCAAKSGRLRRLEGDEPPAADVHSVWCLPPDADAWHLQVLLDERRGGDWIYRREPRVRRPVARLIRPHASGLPILEPAVSLLYKARRARAIDEADFSRVYPRLEDEPRAWLLESLRLAEPGHPWIARLKATATG